MPGANQAWVCTVCGYIHRGAEPPETCPVCGAPRELFERQADAPPPPAAPGASRWRCLDCGYIHVGPQPPAKCPDCGAPPERFELLTTDIGTTVALQKGTVPFSSDENWDSPPPVDSSALGETAGGGRASKVVVVGAGIAAVAAVESLRTASPSAEITVISKEAELPYYRLNLTRYLAGEIGEADLPLHPAAWYEEQKIRLLLGAEATAIRLDDHVVELHGGETLPFDKLLLAAGAHPFIPPFLGTDRAGVTSLRTVEDARRILAACRGGGRCVCIGGGILGLETAGALARQGADVTLLEGHGWLLPRQLNPRAGQSSTTTSPPPASSCATRPSRGNSSATTACKGSSWKTAR